MSTTEAPAQPVVQPVTRADVLHRAADLLEEFGHTKGALARTDAGDECEPEDTAATSFCVQGALRRANRDLGTARYSVPYDVLGVGSAHEWNNAPERTKAEVVARLRAAANTSPQ